MVAERGETLGRPHRALDFGLRAVRDPCVSEPREANDMSEYIGIVPALCLGHIRDALASRSEPPLDRSI